MYGAEESVSLTGPRSSIKRTVQELECVRNFSRNMILTLVPEVGADRQDGATESAGPLLVIDVAVSRRQETGALGADELALSGTHAHAAVHPVCQSKLQGRARLVFENVLASVKEVRFVCPGWPQEAFQVCFVENGDGSAPAS